MVKVRFAPSPTGYLHVGNTRTALANYLFARKENGILVLRIEDTDMERSDTAYEASILEDLRWLGISWEEGPFRQSERIQTYRTYIDVLLEKGDAYKCFCSKERLEEIKALSVRRGEPPRYDGTCRNLSGEAVHRMESEGKPYVVRFRSPRRAVRFTDLIHGETFFPDDHVDDFILLKQELTPSYNFAVTVDDMLMEITHVIRGSDHLSNTPKQILLFQALDRTPPQYAHHSLLTGPDRRPLSKRHGATQVREFRDIGILPAVLANYVAIIGRKVKKEIMERDEMINTFTVKSLSSSDSLFDMGKLFWFNKEYIRNMPVENLLGASDIPPKYRDEVVILQENSKTLAELKEYLDIFDGTDIKDDGIAYLSAFGDLTAVVAAMDGLPLDGGLTFDDIVKEMEHGTGLTKRDLFMVLRIILTGRKSGPPLKEVFPLLKKDTVTKRMLCLKRQFSLS
ncbi:MAG: glutamate--tRNA ligase [Syntrophobacterales bacterium]|jgi:glutamyl-tRNA synthetase|nr:glutamate--tRNA ligase [Syntrophobacterales bacterium]